jgi:uncharacterized glyoxalase superfamily protein PhnB
MSRPTLFHSLTFDDAHAAMEFLEAVGFVRAAVFTDEGDPTRVVHAAYTWRDHGGVMFGSRRLDNADGFVDSTGHGQCYCVVERDADVDRIHAAALAAGATSVQPPADPEYGGRGCTVRDPEGNQWSFGSYPGV